MSGRPFIVIYMSLRRVIFRPCIKGWTQIFNLTYQLHTCRTSCFAIIFKIQLIFDEKIKINVYANQDESLANLKTLATVMISIVFSS